jgi:DNA adenine methylase|tara:strand:- start:956 stop:1873 length:918 start_codon:yes stop_codon:yes gene_type:complete
MVHICKPIIKWVGGKTQILPTLMELFPKNINNYHEIFLGGGSVLLGLLSMVKHNIIHVRGNILAYDLNEPLIYLYKNIQSNPELLSIDIEQIITQFKKCNGNIINRKPSNFSEACTSSESFYYWNRSLYNNLSPQEKNSIYGSALFLFLNKTCFRGVFRVGPNGFNVPYGHYKNPEIMNKEHLYEIHQLIQNVVFQVLDFVDSIETTVTDDFVYLDPPYVPEHETSFVGYTINGFNTTQHEVLFDICKKQLYDKNIKMMMSNSDVPLTRNTFKEPEYTVDTISCKRSINSKKPGSKTSEIIIRNY